MSPRECPRLFEVEAMRDGRLASSERASFEQHAATCSTCSHEMRALEALSRAYRASSRDVFDELHVRRGRTRLIAAFDGVLVSPKRARASGVLAFAALAAVVAATALVLWRPRGGVARAPTTAVVRAGQDASWSARRDGDHERIVLSHGTLSIHVEHTQGGGRLVLTLPDGELEDIGTTFTVSTNAEHTTRVAVAEGRVLLRLSGRPQLVIGAGESWSPETSPPVVAATPPPAAAPSAEPAPRELRSEAARSPSPPASGSAPSDFRGGMAALERGDNRQAANLFRDFIAKHPGDRQAEDAAYLRVIALQRCGDVAGTQEAAREYLQRYPDGFRRLEMEQLSR
jgi:hypothetical protein